MTHCSVCKEFFDEYSWTIKISDDKKSEYITGHQICIDELFVRMKQIKNVNTKSVDKILKEINLMKE